MSLEPSQTREIKELLIRTIRRKLREYNPETRSMPFHTRLLGKNRMAVFSFIQSVNTTLGTSIFEQVAQLIAIRNFKSAKIQYKGLSGTISSSAQSEIQVIIDELRAGSIVPDKLKEVTRIIEKARSGEMRSVKQPTIDLYLLDERGKTYLFDLKTAKPNRGEIIGFKRSLLEWIAIYCAQNDDSEISTALAIPYNPYSPRPYDRWTFNGMFDAKNELLVAEEFWDFLGGDGTYMDVLVAFEEAGLELSPEFHERFEKL